VRDTEVVPLNLDTSTPLRSLPRLEELVRAVRDSPASTQEQPFVEWKSEGDASEKKWRAELAHQVLGMANRDPDAAGAWFGGCAYILLGVAPGELRGTRVHDSADIEKWLAPYVGRTPDGPEWTSTFPEIDGKHVLVLTIEPPKWGDPIWTCHKEYLADPRAQGPTDAAKAPVSRPKVALRAGAIYVRHKASTEEADAADIAMLQRRLLGNRRRIGGISVLLTLDSMAVPVDANPETVAAWAERERKALEPPPPPKPKREPRTIDFDELRASSSVRSTAEMLASIQESAAAALQAASFGYEPDKRTREDYDKQVETYIGKATNAMPAFVLRRMFDRDMGRVTFLVRNDTDDPIHKLQVQIHIPVDGVKAFDYGDLPDVELPRRPVILGKGGRNRFASLDAGVLSTLRMPDYGDLGRNIVPSVGRGVRIDNSGSVTLTFDPVDLLPRETVDLAEVQLFTSLDYVGTTLAAEWTARSLDASGVLPGTVDIPVDAHAPTIEELMAEPEEPPEEPVGVQDGGEDDGD
jgi:hypothetical protein